MHLMSRGVYLDRTFGRRRRRRTWWPWVATAIAITTLIALGDLINLIFGRP